MSSLKNLNITLEDIRIEVNRRKYRRKDYLFPEHGALSYDKYAKHLEFFDSTAGGFETAFMAANRVGKSEAGAFAVACWATGEYPAWWQGRRFDNKVNILVAGETGKLVRDSLQVKLLGEHGNHGTGLIPKENIHIVRAKHGLPDAVDYVIVRGVYGESVIQFMSYDQGREPFQATARDVVWHDEEPPLAIYTENVMRTMTTKGLVLLTFTPLKGLSDVVLFLREKEQAGDCKIVCATWDDAPHLSTEDKDKLFKALPPFQREARSKGVPQLGSGAVYPVSEDDIIVDDFVIPPHFRRVYGLDVGWNNTAAVWLAHDADNDIVYVTGEYKRGNAEPASHAAAIRARGEMPGVIDPASAGSGQADGRKIIDLYCAAGLDLRAADNSVEAGIFDIYDRMTTGRFKVFRSCVMYLGEQRIYRRDEKGRIVKQNDHLMDATRYGVRSGLPHAVAGSPEPYIDPYAHLYTHRGSWMG